MANARELALQTLTDILIEGAYSNHALSEQIEKNELTVQDKAGERSDIMANARELALQTLTDILIEGAYSNHALSEQIEKNELTVQDKNFMTELVYGTLQHEQLLNFYVTPFFKGKVKAWIRILIQMTLYQILFLDSVPEHAAISEAVKIAKKRGGQFNGIVFQNMQRFLKL